MLGESLESVMIIEKSKWLNEQAGGIKFAPMLVVKQDCDQAVIKQNRKSIKQNHKQWAAGGLRSAGKTSPTQE